MGRWEAGSDVRGNGIEVSVDLQVVPPMQDIMARIRIPRVRTRELLPRLVLDNKKKKKKIQTLVLISLAHFIALVEPSS